MSQRSLPVREQREPTVTIELGTRSGVSELAVSLAYELARTGHLPTLRLKKRIVVGHRPSVLRLLDTNE